MIRRIAGIRCELEKVGCNWHVLIADPRYEHNYIVRYAINTKHACAEALEAIARRYPHNVLDQEQTQLAKCEAIIEANLQEANKVLNAIEKVAALTGSDWKEVLKKARNKQKQQ
jgi:hypothetical protein